MKTSCPSIAALLLLSACSQVTPVTTETSGPTIAFTQSSVGNITSLSYSPDTNTQVFFNAVATDPGGVKSLTLTFDQLVTSCTTTGGAVVGGGTFPYSPVPANQSTSSTPDSNGQVPNELFTVTTLQGPYTCQQYVTPGTSRPYGDTINATAVATNYSGKTTTSTLPITLSGWP